MTDIQYLIDGCTAELLEKISKIRSPIFSIDRKNRLVHVYSFGVKAVEETIKEITSKYTTSWCVMPSYIKCFDFADDADLCTVIIALTLQFGKSYK